MNNRHMQRLPLKLAALFSLLVLLLNSCTFSLFDTSGIVPATTTPPYPLPPTTTPQPMAEITFDVTLPAPLLPGETLVLSVVDEVTGLALNFTNYAMTGQDTLHYRAVIPFTMNSVIKYRYVRQGTLPVLEDDSIDRPVRYRMFFVNGPGSVQDIVASWSDTPFSSPVGRIVGQVTDSSTGTPIPNILVEVGGKQTLTDSNGTFIFEGLPPGTQNLVAYALDGTYTTFQQGARVDPGMRTPVSVSLTPAPLVNVIFTVIVPRDTIPAVPIRLAGSLSQLGNTFGDLDGGISTVATRMPVLSPLADGRYTISLMLPVGADIRYKYTLGDGFWNAEHHNDGSFVVRQLVVPAGQATIQVQDVVDTWKAGSSAPILFEVSVPASTSISDIISIQFNPYGWTEPIPMWPLGNNQWVYQLFSPLNILYEFEYRYCRNDQCGIADDVQTPGSHRGRPVATSLTPQDLQDTITGWTWLQTTTPTSLVDLSVPARPAGFWAGVEFQKGYDPTWQAWMTPAIQNIQGIGANWLVLTPTWTVSRTSPFIFSPIPGRDPLWADTVETVSRARAVNLNVALFPMSNLPGTAKTWWSSAARDAAWWDAWFNRYQAFASYHADLATKSGAQALILGGDWLGPALTGGTLDDGSGSNVPADADSRWRSIITEVRQRFSGKVYWALSYPGGLTNAPAFIIDLDGVYLLWNAPLSTSAAPTVQEMQTKAGSLMDTDLQPFQASVQKPVILAVAYPSVTGAAGACLSDGAGGCLSWDALNQPSSITSVTVNLQTQADIYQSMLNAVNSRAWIGGFVSRGYYPPAELQDYSASIHGKQPTTDMLWYWFPRLLGVTK